LVLDETLPAFDANYVQNMGVFLSRLCARLKMDILLVAHNPAFVDAADHAYKISKRGGAARFEKIR
jgi:ABC-type sulfate/molybdate transport systems ATPase subunit